jgi:site-specific DNA-methyltransferase (adenine-specific)
MKYKLNNIYNEDSYKAIKDIPDNFIDVIITDPPYGLGIDYQKENKKAKNNKHFRKEHKKEDWDSTIPPKWFFEEMKRVSKNMIVFGANYMNEYLEQGFKGWIVWDKGQHGLTMSDCELIYTNFNKPTRVIVVNRYYLKQDVTIHPTQKPLKLLLEIIENYTKENDLIVDFFAGSGSTLEACQIKNRNYIGFEKNKNYYNKIVSRLNGIKPNGQTSMFTNFDELQEDN